MRWWGIAAVVVACGWGTAAGVVELAPDESLLPASYSKYGLPDVNRAWTASEYSVAASLVERVARDEPLRLPRLNSLRSGPIFTRLVSPDNLAAITASDTSLVARAELMHRFSDTTRRVVEAYAEAEDSTGKLFFDEQLALQAYMLRTLRAGDAMLAETLDALPPGAAGRDGVAASQAKLREAMGNCVTSLVGVLRISRYSFSRERLRAMRDLQALLPEVYRLMPEADREELKTQLEEMSANEFDPMWRVCAATLDTLALLDDPGLPAKPRVIGARDVDRNIIRRSP